MKVSNFHRDSIEINLKCVVLRLYVYCILRHLYQPFWGIIFHDKLTKVRSQYQTTLQRSSEHFKHIQISSKPSVVVMRTDPPPPPPPPTPAIFGSFAETLILWIHGITKC